jgi:transcriptional regulator GlxA family with amidase domain
VRVHHGLTIVPDGTLDEPFDWLVVSGGSWAARKDVGAWGEIARGELPRALAMSRERGTSMASVCTGAMILSAAGITKGRRAVTHHVALDALRSEGAIVVDARVVDEGDLVTAGGVTSGIDLALWLVERHFGKELADGIARQMEYTRVGPVSRTEVAT